MSNFPSLEEWKSFDAVLSADRHGFNALRDLYGILCEKYPDMVGWTIGFCPKKELPEWMSLGWKFLEVSHLQEGGMDTFNDAMPLRFGLTGTAEGHVMWRENYIMIMPREFRDKLMAARNERSERLYKDAQRSRKYVAAGDARGTSDSSYQEQHLSVDDDGTPKRRGRPPGSKNN